MTGHPPDRDDAAHPVFDRLRALAGPLMLLMAALPDLEDAFDADALPISFILERDGNRAAHDPAATPPLHH
jgi:hypothetical protein